MGQETLRTIVGVLTGIIGLATLAVVLSKNADTGNIITATGTALSNSIKAADGPVTSGSNSLSSFGLSN